MPLPESYLSPRHLPFNSTALAGRFQFESPGLDPGGDGVWVVLRGSELLVTEDAARQLPGGAAPVPPGPGYQPLYLGRYRGRPCRALRLEREAELPAGLVAESLLAPDPALDIEQLSLGGLAGQALHWQRNAACCSRCGAATVALPGEWGRRCSDCGAVHFPHIHPCVIVLVRRGNEVLLTRKAEWPAGRYSLVAGFLDMGECLEEAVDREVMEETGIAVRDVRYLGSQCWPFPSQVMAGFVAEYRGGELQVDETELEDARWFRVDALPVLPPRRSIARYILDTCCGG